MKPRFYKENQAGNLFLPRYDVIQREVEDKGNQYPYRKTEARTTLFVIDAQNCFCLPAGSLYVPGAERDTARLCEFIYRNTHSLDKIYCSLDTHSAYQIFLPAFWVCPTGRHPQPYTMISAAEIKDGKWMAAGGERDTQIALAYIEELEKAGKYSLIIWPFHGMKGSVDNALVPILSEALHFYALLTRNHVDYKVKGEERYTESYSVLSPEVQQVEVSGQPVLLGHLDVGFMEELLTYDRVYIAGQASSHCVKATIEDILGYIRVKEMPASAANRFYILEDCMSPVIAAGVDFPGIAQQAIEEFRRAGMNIVKSTDNV